MQGRTLNGAAVKALREVLGLPATTFATECLMSPGQLSNIENDRKTASEQAARRIVCALERHYQAAEHARTHRSTPVDLELALTYPTLTKEEAA